MSKIYDRRGHLKPTQGQNDIIACIKVHNNSLINELHKNVSRVRKSAYNELICLFFKNVDYIVIQHITYS